jgi:hypothetical protein
LVLDEIREGVAVGAEGEAGEPQVLALPRPEPLPTAEDGAAHEHDGHDRRYAERWTHPSPLPHGSRPRRACVKSPSPREHTSHGDDQRQWSLFPASPRYFSKETRDGNGSGSGRIEQLPARE